MAAVLSCRRLSRDLTESRRSKLRMPGFLSWFTVLHGMAALSSTHSAAASVPGVLNPGPYDERWPRVLAMSEARCQTVALALRRRNMSFRPINRVQGVPGMYLTSQVATASDRQWCAHWMRRCALPAHCCAVSGQRLGQEAWRRDLRFRVPRHTPSAPPPHRFWC